MNIQGKPCEEVACSFQDLYDITLIQEGYNDFKKAPRILNELAK